MKREYLTSDMILQIEQQSKDPIWHMGILASFKNRWFDIMSVSARGLIYIHGNKDTGWAHILSRHSYYSNDLYFGQGAIGNPSRFKALEIPIFDWRQIADDVFILGKIDEKAHPDGDLFVKYVGRSSRFTDSNGESKDFILILYRGTRIVHSMFPKKSLQPDVPKSKLRNLKRALNYVKVEKPLFNDCVIIRIPYVDAQLIERFSIIIHIDINIMQGLAHLQVNGPNGQPLYSISKLLGFDFQFDKADFESNHIEFNRFINSFTKYTDFSHIEEVMVHVENKYLFSKE